jgi:hypothetical protein
MTLQPGLDKPLPHRGNEQSTNDDRGSLNLLAKCHIIFGVLGLTGGIGIGITNWDDSMALGGAIVCSMIFALLLGSGLSMLYHCYRNFSLVVASIISLGFPAGTILGVWIIVVLRRPGVKQLYLRNKAG